MPFSLQDKPIENLRPLSVRVIGAGYSGIYAGIRIPQRLRNIDLVIYEKNEDIGGTWWENRYPGCACDIPSHSYQYSFAPNPNWSAFYAPAAEICEYLQGVAERFGVRRWVKTEHKVVNCRWDENVKKWSMTVLNTKTGESFEDTANVLISARGNLNDIAWPDIPGLRSFEGEVMHSAKWNQEYDFRDKKIGVIGGGSSAIQIVPSLQKLRGTKMTCFVRSKTWISNPFGDGAMEKLGLDTNQVEFTEAQRTEFRSDPSAYLEFRKIIEADGNTIHGVTHKNSDLQRGAVEAFRAMMSTRLAKHPEIFQAMVPSFAVGCRRLTPGVGYLEALVEDNVTFVSDPIASITPAGVELTNGQSIPLDDLVCATGFHTSSLPPFPIYGRNGLSLQTRFTPHPSTYLSMAVDGFPNFFMMLGPNSAIGSGSLTMMIESEGDYIVRCIRKLQKENYASMSPLPGRVKDFGEYCEEYFKGTVYTDECSSWYRKNGRVTGLWPGSTLHCLEALRSPRWEDFEWETREDKGGNGGENRLGWLGNGWSVTQLGEGDPAWYLESGVVSVPLEGKPEEDEEFKRRPFSY